MLIKAMKVYWKDVLISELRKDINENCKDISFVGLSYFGGVIFIDKS